MGRSRVFLVDWRFDTRTYNGPFSGRKVKVQRKGSRIIRIGDEKFERVFRVQQNTVEQLVIFLPSILAAGFFANEIFAAVVGVAFIVGRGLYFVGYTQNPEKRGMGMIITFGANVALLLGGIVGALLAVV